MCLIELDRASLSFRVRQQRQLTLKEYLLKGMFLERNNPVRHVRALQDVSLRLHEGERVGILGANGSGKSTLLRLLAGIYHPTSGHCTVRGKVSSLFDLTLGFEMEATGWNNIRYRGYLQGETATAIRAKMQSIAEFSELGPFLDIPVRYYSAGMMVRLAFSIATAIQPEVLLVDEVLGAGDLAFQAKAQQRLRQTMNQARLLVVVSHDLGTLPKLCERGIWLDRGRVRADGRIRDVINAYVDHVEDKRGPTAPTAPAAADLVGAQIE